MKTIQHAFEFLVFQCASMMIGLFPLKIVRRVGAWLGGFTYSVLGFRRKVVQDNLKNAFPELSINEREQIARGSFQSVGVSLVELLWFPHLTRESAKEIVRIEHQDVLDECSRRGKGVVILTAHIGNWELAPVSVRLHSGFQIHSLYKPQSNPWIDRKILFRRTKFGARVVPMGGAREVLRILQEGECVLIAADQSAPRESLRMKFFTREVPVFQGPAVFCLKTGAPLVAAFCIRQSDGSYNLECTEIRQSDLVYDENGVQEMTRRHVVETERIIRKYPNQWMWMHRRWKHSQEPA